MKRKKCIRPQHGRIYKEGDEGFELNECECGAPLQLIDDDAYDTIPEELSANNDECCDKNVDIHTEEKPQEEVIPDDVKEEVTNTQDSTQSKKMQCTNQECRMIYEEGHEAYEDGFCEKCGYALELMGSIEPVSEVPQNKENQVFGEPASVSYESEKEEVIPIIECCIPRVDDDPIIDEAVSYGEKSEENIYNSFIRYSVDSEGYIHFPKEEGYRGEALKINPVKCDEYENYKGDRIVIYHNKEKYRTIPLEYDETVIGRKGTSSSPDVDLTEIDAERRISRRHALIYRYQGEYYIRNISSKNSLHVNSQALLLDEQTKLEDGAKIVLSRFVGIKFCEAVGGECDE